MELFQWILQNSVMFWLLMVVVMLVAELLTLGLTTIWFAFGALVALVLAAVGSPFAVQFGAFAVVSLLVMALARNAALEHFNHDRARTNVDALVGQKAIVTQSISNVKAQGQAVLNGMEWTARGTTEEEIEEGAVVVVRNVSGVKLIVEKEEGTVDRA
ncbi:MAG: NfeD family protein [Lachnospiraceae bacterium]|nr:NfeD family protein [Lachnospiraceae bacterium]